MIIYKFRITLEENDSYLREIEIKPGQTFLDFHNAILDCSILTKEEMASFFICDIKWRKHQEITLVKMEEVEDRRRPATDRPPVKIMSETTLSTCINNPNEQLIYINDFQKVHTFYIELFKIYNSEEKATFPRCVKRVSDLPKIIKTIPGGEPSGFVEEEEEVVDEFDVEFDDSQIGDDDSLLGDIFEESSSADIIE
jgi:hypothetical protein